MNLPVVILAGGLATRLRPLTEKIPKSLIDIHGRPFAEIQLDLLRAYGVRRVIFCVGYLGEMVQAALGDGRRWGMNIHYVFDGPVLLGTGGALRRALPCLGEAFLIMYGDSYLECDYGAVENAFIESGKSGLMTVFRNQGLWDRSNVVFTDGRIVCYDKVTPRREMEHIDYGLGALRASVFSSYDADAPLDLAQVYSDLLAQDQLAGYEVPRRFYEIGSASGLEETRMYLSGKAGG